MSLKDYILLFNVVLSYYEKIGDKTFCIDEEIPFAVPDGWEWCRLGYISKIVMGQSPPSSSVSLNKNELEFHQGKIFFTEKYISNSEQYTSAITKIADKNSVLLCVRAPVGIVNITERKIGIGRGLCAITPLGKIQVEFIFYWLTAFQNYFIEKATGTTFTAITIDVVKQQLIPLPPTIEQCRITKKIKHKIELLKEIIDNLN